MLILVQTDNLLVHGSLWLVHHMELKIRTTTICDFEDTYVISATSVIISFYEDPSGENDSNCQLDGTFMFNYTFDGNIITYTEEGFTSEIIMLNNTTLIFSNTETFEGIVFT